MIVRIFPPPSSHLKRFHHLRTHDHPGLRDLPNLPLPPPPPLRFLHRHHLLLLQIPFIWQSPPHQKGVLLRSNPKTSRKRHQINPPPLLLQPDLLLLRPSLPRNQNKLSLFLLQRQARTDRLKRLQRSKSKSKTKVAIKLLPRPKTLQRRQQ